MSNNLLQTHGDVKPVFAIDQTDGAGSVSTGVAVQVAGPKLDFFGIDLGADPSGKLSVNSAVDSVIKSIAQLATVHMYQIEASASANNMSIAIYPTAAWTAAAMQTAIRALGTVDSYDLSGAVVTNVGFKLAAA
jgi:hypothetical protein